MDILLVEELVPEAVAWLKARHSVEYQPELARDLVGLRLAAYTAHALVLPRKVVVTQEFLESAPLLKVVARMHASTDNTDLEACRERNVRVIQATSSSIRSNAEYLLASLLLLYRRGIGTSLAGERHAESRLGRELSGSVVGLLGLAPTAHTLAAMLRSLGVKLIGYDPAVHHTAPIWNRLGVQAVSAKDLVSHADAVTVQVLYASRYQGFINNQMLVHCKPGQIWVGISRSRLFDGPALARALTDGRIEACMLDGGESGFASLGTSLHELKNLFLTPRLGSHTRESRLRASWYVAHRIHETLSSMPAGVDHFPSAPMGLDDPAATPAPGFIIR